MDALLTSTGTSRRVHKARAPLEFSFTFDSPQPVRERVGNKGTSQAVPALVCIYCAGLYSPVLAFNAKQDSRNFICVHCTKRIETEVEETNRCSVKPGLAEHAASEQFLSQWEEERTYYRKALGEIKDYLQHLEKTLSDDHTECRGQIEALANEVAKLQNSRTQQLGLPLATAAPSKRPASTAECSSPEREERHLQSGLPSTCSKSPSKSGSDYKVRNTDVPNYSRKKYVHIVGDSKVGVLEGELNKLLAGDRRCRFFVYRRASFCSIIDKIRRRILLHNPKTSEQLIILHAGLHDLLSDSLEGDMADRWVQMEARLDALATDCRRNKIRLVVCELPTAASPPESPWRKACDYINGALRLKFSGTQVIVKDLSHIGIYPNKVQSRHLMPGCEGVSLEARNIASEIERFLRLNNSSSKTPAKNLRHVSESLSQAVSPSTPSRCVRKPPFFQQAHYLPFPPPPAPSPPYSPLVPVTYRRPTNGQKSPLYGQIPNRLRRHLYLNEY